MSYKKRSLMATKTLSLPSSADILRVVLPNGITVLARENFSNQSVVISGSLAVGSLLEPDDKQGLSDFVAAALMRGTRNRDFDALHEALESIGANLGVSGGTHSTGFGGKALAEDLGTLLGILSDVLRHPSFPVDQTERLRGEILTGLRIRMQDTRSVAFENFRSLAYPPDHPYSRTMFTLAESLPHLSLDDLRAFHAKNYGAQGMIIAIVGAVKAEDAVKMVAEQFGDWHNPEQPAMPSIPEVPLLPEPRQCFKKLDGKTQSDIVIGWIGPSRFAPDFQAANLANNILGVFGMMGRLGATVREAQGLAYYAYSTVRGGHGPTPWTAAAGVNPKNVQRAIASILNEIQRLTSELVSEEELADNKANFTGSLPLSLETNEGVAAAILNMETFKLGLDYLQNYAEMINAITREDVLKAAQKYLSPKAYALSVAGPELRR
ncbi:MAG: insulinase family protein [Candidatus Thermofonsia Clade 1 bacterium]|uniref:Insulinase family protein n=3 Tax=Candidatus Thermofonsia Clade 1 bacterium TaxID=2364210 RepID=A0A2M8PZP7_9CHLR|nr:MAG: insulinase family protein [Candidatus Thermofonsia Clade 1 bacterium]